MKKHDIKQCLVWFKKMFIRYLTGLINRSNHTKYVSLRNQKCMIEPSLINLYPNEYIQELN